jgi:hypothetical protein
MGSSQEALAVSRSSRERARRLGLRQAQGERVTPSVRRAIGPGIRRTGWLAVALLAVASSPARAGGLLTLSAVPRTSGDRGADLSLELDPAAVADAAPLFTASVGRIAQVRRTAPRRFAATWLPPSDRLPEVAIVAASASGRAGWIAIRPGGRGAEEVPHVHVAAARAEAAADVSQEVRIWVFAVSADGRARRGAPVSVVPTRGWVTPLAEIAPGAYTGLWLLPPGGTEPVAALARLEDETIASPEVLVRRPPGPPAHLALEADRPGVVAGDERPLRVRVRVTDLAGNAVAVAAPELEVDRGSLSPPTRTDDGAWDAWYRAPEDVRPGAFIALAARAAGLEGSLALTTEAGAPQRLVVAAGAPRIVADGRAEVVLEVRLLDRYENPVADAAGPVVTALLPATIAAEPAGDGAWRVRYRPERARADATERLLVHAATLDELAEIEVIAPERRLAVAVEGGLAGTAAGARAPAAAAEVSYRLPALAGRLALALEVGTLAHSRTDAVAVGGGAVQVDGDSRWIPLVALARWSVPLGARWAAWADAGGGAAWVDAKVRAGNGPAPSESDVVGVVHGALAAGPRLGHGTPYLELGWMGFGAPHLERVGGNLSVFTVSLGYRHDAY